MNLNLNKFSDFAICNKELLLGRINKIGKGQIVKIKKDMNSYMYRLEG